MNLLTDTEPLGEAGTPLWLRPDARAVLDRMAEYFVVLDRNYDVVFVNRALAEAAPGLQLVGRNPWRLWPETRGTVMEAAFAKAFESGEERHFEFHHATSDVWFQVDAYPQDGHLAVYFRDTTDSKRAKEALRESVRVQKLVFDAVPACVSYIDADQRFVATNATCAAWFGRPVEGIVGLTMRELIGDEAYARRAAMIERALSGEAVLFETPVRLPDGRLVDALTHYVPDVREGRVEGFVAMVQDVSDQRRSERALRESETLARSVVQTVVEGVIVVGRNGAVLASNSTFDRLFSGDGAPGGPDLRRLQSSYDLYDGEGRLVPFQRWPVVRALDGERVERWDLRVRRKADGREWWGSYAAAPVVGTDGRTLAAVMSVFDISDRVRTERELRDAKIRIEGILASGEVATWVWDVESNLVYADRNLARMFGFDEESPEGVAFEAYLERIHPDERESVGATISASIEKGAPYDVQYRVLARGEERWLTARGFAERDESGKIVRLPGVVVDITELKRAQERERAIARELGESAERFRLLVESVPEAAWTATPEGLIDYYNDRWYEYTGMERGPAADMGWARYVHPEDLPGTEAAWMRSIRTGDPYEMELRLRSVATGEYRWFLARARPLRDAEGRIARWFGMTIDVHEAKIKQRTLTFLGDLAEAKRALADPETIMAAATRMIGEHIGASRCAYASVDEDASAFTIVGDWSPGMPSIAGTYEAVRFGTRIPAMLLSGQTLVSGDLPSEFCGDPGAESLAALGVRALVCVPLVKEGRLVAMLAVQQGTPRRWSREEVALIETVADRCWSSIERANAERALRLSEAQYRQIAEGLPQLVWSALPTGEQDYFNRRWYDFTGTAPVESARQVWSQVVHPDDQETARAQWERSVHTGEPYEEEYRIRRYDGRYRWVLCRALPIRDDTERIVRWFGACTDIHEQKSTERALNATIEVGRKLSTEFDTAQIVQALTDAATAAIGAEFGSFFYALPDGGTDAFGLYASSGVAPSGLARLSNLRSAIRPAFGWEATVRVDDAPNDPRYRSIQYGDLPVRSFLSVVVRARDGEVLGGLLFGHSEVGRFSEEHERLVESMASQASIAYENAVLYRRLRAANEELERKVVERTADLQASNDALISFNYHVSHDLRAPLRAIVGTSRIIQEDYGDYLPSEAVRLLDRQAEAGNKLGRLIDDLLRYSRLSREELDKRPLDLSALAREVAGEALSEHTDREARVVVDDGLVASADPRLLKLALHNLVENAVKYSPGGGIVRVGRSENGAFFVSDEGIGIEPQYFAKIFQPFQRLHRDEEFKGTGIGLSNVRQIITRHGGEVWVESEFGQGSTFYFTL